MSPKDQKYGSNLRSALPFFIAVAYTLIAIALLLVMGHIGWQGRPNGCIAQNEYHCEFINENAIIKQPINTWSNLAYVFAGYIILFWDKAREKSPPRSLSSERPAIRGMPTVLYGFLVITIGLTSMFFHASMTSWGGGLDTSAMNAYILLLFIYEVSMLLGLSKPAFWGLYIPAALGSFCLRMFIWDDAGIFIFTAVLLGFVMVEVCTICFTLLNKKKSRPLPPLNPVVCTRMKQRAIPNRESKWLAIGLLLFASGYAIWNLFQTGTALCNPHSWFQGHAVWHLLTAIATLAIFQYFQSEKIPDEVNLQPKNS